MICLAKEVILTEVDIEENDLLNRAIAYAVAMHRGGVRKGTNIPYIVHPLEVMHNLLLMKADKKLMAAGVLHDTVEDTEARIEDIQVLFGQEVASLVASHTEEDKNLPWSRRKKIALEHLAKANRREKILVLADKLSNMRAINRDYQCLGDKLWERFNQGKDQQEWYYQEGVKALADLKDDPDTTEMYKEFVMLVNDVFAQSNVDEFYQKAQASTTHFVISDLVGVMIQVLA